MHHLPSGNVIKEGHLLSPHLTSSGQDSHTLFPPDLPWRPQRSFQPRSDGGTQPETSGRQVAKPRPMALQENRVGSRGCPLEALC